MPDKLPPSEERMVRAVGAKQERMLRARDDKGPLWNQIAIFGMVGWSVAVPTLIGVAAGVWIDHRWPSHVSWTLMLLIAGLVIGCLSAWMKVKEDR